LFVGKWRRPARPAVKGRLPKAALGSHSSSLFEYVIVEKEIGQGGYYSNRPKRDQVIVRSAPWFAAVASKHRANRRMAKYFIDRSTSNELLNRVATL
jgi:hypothetical protein